VGRTARSFNENFEKWKSKIKKFFIVPISLFIKTLGKEKIAKFARFSYHKAARYIGQENQKIRI
jgi:hypothetical protein